MSTTSVPDVSIPDTLGRIDRTLSNRLQQNGFHTLADLYEIKEDDWKLVSDIPHVGIGRMNTFWKWVDSHAQNAGIELAPWMKRARKERNI